MIQGEVEGRREDEGCVSFLLFAACVAALSLLLLGLLLSQSLANSAVVCTVQLLLHLCGVSFYLP